MQVRKLGALRKSLGKKIADKAFAEWLKEQSTASNEQKTDPVAAMIVAALKPLEKDKSLNLGQHGYSIRRSKGRGPKGFIVTRIEKPASKTVKKRPVAKKRGPKPAG